jgi:hypothetical protein
MVINNGDPRITIWKRNYEVDYPIVKQGSARRDWMDKTFNKLAYYCSPMTTSNLHGWEFRLPQDIVVKWDGVWEGQDGEDPSHIQLISGSEYQGLKIATNESGVAQVSFQFNCWVETDPDHYIKLHGPPNYMFPDAEPLSVLWRSDFFNYEGLSLAWKVLTPNKEVVFPKDMPVAFMTIHSKDLHEETSISFKNIQDNPTLFNNFKKYINKRAEFFQEGGPYACPQLYKHGIGPNDEKFLDKPFRPSLKEPKNE